MTRSLRSARLSAVLAAVALMWQAASSPIARAVSPDVVISQVYGGGGNSGATLKNDFIELFNRGTTTVNVTGWSVQYASAAGITWQVTTLNGSVPAGGYYLVQEAAGSSGTVALPAPNATGTIPMSATAGKIALVNSTAALTGSGCPFGGTVVDFVGYGAAANCSEMTPTATLSNTTAARRTLDGCTDSDNNATDFAVGAPTPRNTSSPPKACGPTDPVGIGAASPSLLSPGESTLLTVAVTPGMNPDSTGLSVVGDLSPIGGSATQSFFDNGTNGDVIGGDNRFSFRATAGDFSGRKTLVVTVRDAQGRSTTASIHVQVPAAVVISQIYGGGGNAGATYRNDYVELYNPGTLAADLGGWSLQYASAAGNLWGNTSQPLGGVIAPGEYFLVSLASGNTPDGAELPPANILGEINMSATAGKIALVSNGDPLVEDCPLDDPDLVDFVGYGLAATCREGATNAPVPSNTVALFRKDDGSLDTNSNGQDFATGAPSPRRTAPIMEIGPYVFNTDPRRNAPSAPRDASITVNFTEPVDVSDGWYDISCADTGSHNDATVAGSSKTYVITPNVNFLPTEQCTVTIFKDQVHDQDPDDGAPNTDTLRSDVSWTFTVSTGTPPPYAPDVHLTMGNPSGATADLNVPDNYLMEKPEFALSYNRDRGAPNWVSWHLSDEWVGSLVRVDTFRPDPAVPSDWYRVQATDYFNSGFDRGHMTPNADRDKETSAPINQATFLMTNMLPQAPDNNQGPWANFENYLRTLLPANEIYIVSGGAGIGGAGFNGPATTIANGRVTVPAQTWKVALVLPKDDGDDVAGVSASARTIAVLMPNTQGIRTTNPNDWQNYLVSVDTVETLTGYDFFSNVDDPVENSIEAGVNGMNPPGVADQLVTIEEDGETSFELEAASSTTNPLTYTILTPPTHGTLSGSDAGRTYTPSPDFAGTDSFTFRVSDGALTSNVATVTIRILEVNDAPVLTSVPAAVTVSLGETLTFTAVGSDVDVPVQSLSYFLTGAVPAGATIDATTGAFTWTPTGAQSRSTYSFDVVVTDGIISTSITVTVSVVDTTAPSITSVSASPDAIWPANHKLVPVTISVLATDLGGTPSCRVTQVSNNETGSRDAVLSGALHVLLRAERSGGGQGRVYTIEVTCTDAAGNTASATTTVRVAHDQGHGG